MPVKSEFAKVHMRNRLFKAHMLLILGSIFLFVEVTGGIVTSDVSQKCGDNPNVFGMLLSKKQMTHIEGASFAPYVGQVSNNQKGLAKRSTLSQEAQRSVTTYFLRGLSSVWEYVKHVLFGSLFRLFQRLAAMLALNDNFVLSLSGTIRSFAPDYVVNAINDYRRLLPQLRLIYTIVSQK